MRGLLLAFALSWLVLASAGQAEPLRATHYWGRAWPVNFWNSFRMEDVDRDFGQIRQDGFDTIVLVVPWGEFDPGILPCCRQNPSAWQHLDKLTERAAAAGLKVVLRFGYVWSFESGIQQQDLERQIGVFLDDRVLAAFVDHARRLNAHMAKHKNFAFAFITWEDFFLQHVSDLGISSFAGTALEKEYRGFLKRNYSLDQLREMFRLPALASFDAAPFPVPSSTQPGDERVRLFHHFWDDLLVHRIFLSVQKVMPSLSLEVRIDADPLLLPGGGYDWINHSRTYKLPRAKVVTAYYRIPWAMPNQGDLASADQALDKFGRLLKELASQTPTQTVFFDQLLFNDNTPGFETGTRLAPDEINSFLAKLAGPLGTTHGYALWHYRDYPSSYLYNGGFNRGLQGWRTQGEVAKKPLASGDYNIVLSKGAVIGQVVPTNRHILAGKRATAQFCVDVRTASPGALGRLRAIGNRRKDAITMLLNRPGRHCVDTPFAPGQEISLELAHGQAEIEAMYLYRHIQTQGVYQADGTPGPYLSGVRELNRRLALPSRSDKP